MTSEEKNLKEYYEYLFDYPNATAFEDAEEGLKESVRKSWGFEMYNLGCALDELKKAILDQIVKVLPKN